MLQPYEHISRSARIGSEVSRRAFLGWGAAGLGGIGMGFGLSGCGGGSSGGGSASPPPGATKPISAGPPLGGTPVKGGALRVAFVTGGAAESFNLLTGGFAGNQDLTRMYALYDGLVGAAAGGVATPALATSWESSADAKLWTFHLRHGVTFHNGKTFSADDVLYTIQKSWANPKNIYNAVLQLVMDFKGVRKRGKYTIEIPLKTGVADFPTLLSFVQCLIGAAGTTNWADGNGTGAYILGSFHPGVQSVFQANRNYWQEGLPHVDQLVVNSSYQSDSDRFNALLAGQVDIVPNADPALVTANTGKSGIVIGNQPGPGFNELGMHVGDGLFSNAQMREAFQLIPDLPKYAEIALDGYATVGNSCPGYTNKYWARGLKSVQDLDRAKSLIKAAGHEGLTLTLATSPFMPGMIEFATLFKQDAAGAGVNIDIKQFPTSTYETTATGLTKRSFEVNVWTNGVSSLAQFYVTSALPAGPYNVNGWGTGNATFGPANKLLFDALAEKDPAQAEAKWLEVQKIMHTQGSSIIPAFTNWIDAYSAKVRGVQTTSAGNCDNFEFSNAWIES